MLRVGPQSAGAQPGPACYGLGGTEPTVTDANLVLGRLGADRFLGGEMQLDRRGGGARAQDACRRAARHGRDGGGGRHPAHRRDGHVLCGEGRHHRARPRCRRFRARRLWRRGAAARRRGRARARHAQGHRPAGAGRFSAFGMLFSDLRYDFVRTWFTRLDDAAFAELEQIYSALEDEGRAEHRRAPAVAPRRSRSSAPPTCAMSARSTPSRSICRWRCSPTKDREAIKQHFDAQHEFRYGTCAPEERAEIVSLRTTVTGVMRKPPQETIEKAAARRQQDAPSPASARSISARRAASSTRRPMRAPGCSPATASAARR